MNCFFDRGHCLASEIELDTSKCETIVGIGPVLLNLDCLLELLLRLLRLIILLIVAGEIEDGWGVLRIEL